MGPISHLGTQTAITLGALATLRRLLPHLRLYSLACGFTKYRLGP